MRKQQLERLLEARRLLLRWHDSNARRFSWREKIRDPYSVLLCELMGQQTQATRIEEYLKKFLSHFASPSELAAAPQPQILRLWQGLGYNRRAINLHRAMKTIATEHNNIVPDTFEALLRLPGVGPYTAKAVLVFAYQEPYSAIDVNVSRVITRLYSKTTKHEVLLPIQQVEKIADTILPVKQVRAWHEALMDLGATICIKRAPKCDSCPLQQVCPSTVLGKGLRKDKIPSNRTAEKLYYGHPKRIWRGRALKYISNHSGATRSELKAYLKQQFDLDAAKSTAIATLVLPELTAEGFIQIQGGRIELA